MKEKLNRIFGYMIGCFMGSNILMIWIQGGGRYSNNDNLKACLFISIPLSLITGVLIAYETFKEK